MRLQIIVWYVLAKNTKNKKLKKPLIFFFICLIINWEMKSQSHTFSENSHLQYKPGEILES